MVIITGLGRCGTSILTKYLEKIGYGIGTNIGWVNHVRAGYELRTFYTLIHDLYHRFCKLGKPIDMDVECWGDYWSGYTYREALNLVDKDERQGKVDVVKDPRISWHPDIISAIHEAREGDFRVIVCHRKVESVYNSRKSLPEAFDDPKPRKDIWEYKIDFSDFYTRILELDIIHTVMFFPNIWKDFNKFWLKLGEVGLYEHDYKLAKEVYDTLIDPNLLK